MTSVRTGGGFSALQRAEIAEIRIEIKEDEVL